MTIRGSFSLFDRELGDIDWSGVPGVNNKTRLKEINERERKKRKEKEGNIERGRGIEGRKKVIEKTKPYF